MVLDSQVWLFEEAARSSLLSDMFSIPLDAGVQLEGKRGTGSFVVSWELAMFVEGHRCR